MKFDKFTIKAQEALAQANNTASENGNQEIEDMHLLDALFNQADGIIVPILEKLEINTDQIKEKAEKDFRGSAIFLFEKNALSKLSSVVRLFEFIVEFYNPVFQAWCHFLKGFFKMIPCNFF